jgi:CheY-like chemotaxis protein
VSILIAEDNPVNQKVALLQFRQLGYEADLATNGRDVLDHLSRRHYDIIFMDSHMPVIDGLETTREIRRRQALGSLHTPIRIIAMTASAMTGDRETCLAAGMDDYLAKPVHPADLRAVLERNLHVFQKSLTDCTPSS